MVGGRESRGDVMKSEPTLIRSKFARHEPKANPDHAEPALFEEMEHAAEVLQSEEDFGRSGVRQALDACYSYLHVRGLSGQGLKPLVDLIWALENVDRGVLPELFDPKLRPGQVPRRKWSRSAASRETKIHAAACMDALMKGGMPKDEAASRVARFAVWWPRVADGEIKATTVMNWRDELLQGLQGAPDRVRFKGLSEIFSEGPKAKSYLADALRIGPVMTGGVRKRRNSET
jgi:hypothetical protein